MNYWTAPYPRSREHAEAIRMMLRGVKLTEAEAKGIFGLPQKPPTLSTGTCAVPTATTWHFENGAHVFSDRPYARAP